MKKALLTLLIAATAICTSLAIAACGDADDHTGGNNQDPVPEHTHALQHYGEQPATCTEAGAYEYWICTDCGKRFLDEACQNETTEEALAIPATGHDFSAENKCANCGLVWNYTEGLTYELNGDGLSYTVTGIGTATGKVTIPYVYENKPVTGIGKAALADDKITAVTVPASIEEIGDGALSSSSLEEIRIVDLAAWCNLPFFKVCALTDEEGMPVKMLRINPYNLYLNDELVTDLVIPDGIYAISACAFQGCKSIKSVTLPDSVWLIDFYAFADCESLKTVKLGKGITEIEARAFDGDEFEEVYLEDLAAWCDVSFPRRDATMPDVGMNSPLSVTEKLYVGNRLVTDLVIPEGVTAIRSQAFYSCTAFDRIVLPDSLQTIPRHAFYGTKYYANEENWEDGVLYIGKHLIEANGLTASDYTVKEGTLTIADWAFYNARIESITFPESLKNIGAFAFGYSHIENVVARGNIEYIGDAAFYMPQLDYDEDGALYVGNVLIGMEFQSAIYENFAVKEGAVGIANNALEVYGLSNIAIPKSVKRIEDEVFAGYDTYITVSEENPYFSSQDGSLYNKDKTVLMKANVVDGAFTIPNSVKTIGAYAFYESGLTSVVIPNGVTTIGKFAFSRSDLTGIIIPDSVVTIGEQAFAMCPLTELTLGNGVKTIGDEAFFRCPLPISLTLPDSVTTIGSRVWTQCSLTSLTIPNSVKSIGENPVAWGAAETTVYYQGTKKQWNAIVRRYTACSPVFQNTVN